MMIALVNKKDKSHYWVSKYFKPCLKFEKALVTTNLEEVAEAVVKFRKTFKVIVVTNEGDVIQKYE